MKTQKKVLFLCTCNSCRSRMAEAIINNRMQDEWLGVSAGTKRSGYVHPKAIQVLAELEIQPEGETKLANQNRDWGFDLVVTVCDSAAVECPTWLGQGVRFHHSFPDPVEATRTQEEILIAFRVVRDAIAREIPKLIEKFSS